MNESCSIGMPPFVKDQLGIDDVQTIIQTDWPNLPIIDIKALGKGFGNYTFLVNDRYFFRFPKQQDTAIQIQNNIPFLTCLRNQYAFQSIPDNAFICLKSKIYPFPYIGDTCFKGIEFTDQLYRQLSLIERQNALKDVADFFKKLHKTNIKDFKNCTTLKIWRPFASQRALFVELVKENLSAECLAQFIEIYDWYLTNDNYPLHVIHADLMTSNILYDVDQQKISAYLDFDNMCLGDRDFDFFRIAASWGEQALLDILKYYDYPINDYESFSKKIRFYMIYECVNFFRKNVKKYQGSETELRAYATELLEPLLIKKELVAFDFRPLIKS